METLQKTKFSLDAVRSLYEIAPDDFRELLECEHLEDDGDIQRLVKSLDAGVISANEFMRGEFLKANYKFYSSDDYVLTRDSEVLHRDDAYFCDYYEEYVSETELCYIGRHERYYCQEAIDDANLYEYRGNYYDDDALSRHDLVCIDGDIYSTDNVYFWESDGEWHLEPEQDEYVRDYHNNTTPRFVKFSESPKFYIGYEIEKEDQEVKECMYVSDFEDECENWRKERDGSLDDESGYELISPAFELNTDKIKETIETNKTLLKHINADIKTETCGGHVNISESGLSGEDLFEKIQGYTPLFHALYYKRLDKNYSKGKSNVQLKEENEKYQSIRIHSNRLEYRIISAVPNFDTLMWRTRLFELILNNPTSCPKIAFYNVQTILKEHLGIMYQNGRFDKLNQRIIEFTDKYEGIKLNIINN